MLRRRVARAPRGRNPAAHETAGISLSNHDGPLMILGGGACCPSGSFQHGRRAVARRTHTQAIAVAQMQLERLKSRVFGTSPTRTRDRHVTGWRRSANVSFGLDRVTSR